jgi:hypothetical protein
MPPYNNDFYIPSVRNYSWNVADSKRLKFFKMLNAIKLEDNEADRFYMLHFSLKALRLSGSSVGEDAYIAKQGMELFEKTLLTRFHSSPDEFASYLLNLKENNNFYYRILKNHFIKMKNLILFDENEKKSILGNFADFVSVSRNDELAHFTKKFITLISNKKFNDEFITNEEVEKYNHLSKYHRLSCDELATIIISGVRL